MNLLVEARRGRPVFGARHVVVTLISFVPFLVLKMFGFMATKKETNATINRTQEADTETPAC